MHFPDNVGILAIDIYFPSLYVSQERLERYDEIPEGKYTAGLGQLKMGFCTDREDVHSLALTVTTNLLEKYHVNHNEIGRLEVGTESLVDKSKSVKSVLMQLFTKHNNYNIEGVDSINACYGGTAAVFNSIHWVESSYWDGRLALVVMSDIAVYASGNARCTGGAGAIALLIGPNAPLVFDRGLRSSYMEHAYDFYKPILSSEYPLVDGKLSVSCYLKALDFCYQRYNHLVRSSPFYRKGKPEPTSNYNISSSPRATSATSSTLSRDIFNLSHVDACLFHAPFCKLVAKSLGRLWLNDIHKSIQDCLNCSPRPTSRADSHRQEPNLTHTDNGICNETEGIDSMLPLTGPGSQRQNGCIKCGGGISDRLCDTDNDIHSKLIPLLGGCPSLSDSCFNTPEIQKLLTVASSSIYQSKVKPSLYLPKLLGNLYTCSLYSCLLAHLFMHSQVELEGQHLLLFSYGSGLSASMFSITIQPDGEECIICPSPSHPGTAKSSSPSPQLAEPETFRNQNESKGFLKVVAPNVQRIQPSSAAHDPANQWRPAEAPNVELPAAMPSTSKCPPNVLTHPFCTDDPFVPSTASNCPAKSSRFSLANLLRHIYPIKERLDDRLEIDPEEFSQVLQFKESTHNMAPYDPISPTDHLFPGTYFLKSIDKDYRREYERKSLTGAMAYSPLLPLHHQADHGQLDIAAAALAASDGGNCNDSCRSASAGTSSSTSGHMTNAKTIAAAANDEGEVISFKQVSLNCQLT